MTTQGGITQKLEKFLGQQEAFQIRTQLTVNIICLATGGLLYAFFHLVGDFLTTFVFTFIFAIALNSIKRSLISRFEQIIKDQDFSAGGYGIFKLYCFKFSMIARLLKYIQKNLTSLSTLKKTLKTLAVKIYDGTLLPYVFLFYLIHILKMTRNILLFEAFLWTLVDFYTALKYLWKSLLSIFKRPTQQE